MVESRKAAEAEKKSPDKPLHQLRNGEHAEDGDHKNLGKTPPKLFELASKEFDLIGSGGFKTLASELKALKNGVLDFAATAEEFLKPGSTQGKAADHPNAKDLSPSLANDAKLNTPGFGEPKSGTGLTDVPVKTVKVQTIAPDANVLDSVLGAGTFAPASTFTTAQTFAPAADIGKSGNPAKPEGPAKPAEPAKPADPALAPSTDGSLIQPKLVKTVAINEPAPGFTGVSTFQPTSSFSSGPDTTKFSLNGQDTSTKDAPTPNITILKVHTVDLPNGGQPPGAPQNPGGVVGACDTQAAGPQALQPLSMAQFQAALGRDSSTSQPAANQPTDVPPNQNQQQPQAPPVDGTRPPAAPPPDATMNNIMFNPTPIAQQHVPLGPAPSAERTGSTSATARSAPSDGQVQTASSSYIAPIGDVRSASSNNDANCQLQPGQAPPRLTLQGISDLGKPPAQQPTSDSTTNNTMFNPTPIAQQRAPLGDPAQQPAAASADKNTDHSSTVSNGSAGMGASSSRERTGAGKGGAGDAPATMAPVGTPLGSRDGSSPTARDVGGGQTAPRSSEGSAHTSAGRAGDSGSPVQAGHVAETKTASTGDTSLNRSTSRDGESVQHLGKNELTSESSRRSEDSNGKAQEESKKLEASQHSAEQLRSESSRAELLKSEKQSEQIKAVDRQTEASKSDASKLEKTSLASSEQAAVKSLAQESGKSAASEQVSTKKNPDAEQQVFRSVGVVSPVVESSAAKNSEIASLANLANTLARAAQPTSVVTALDAAAGKGGAYNDSSAIGKRGELLGPISLSALSGASANASDGILGAGRFGSRTGTSGSDAAALSPLGTGLSIGRTGSSALDTAIANASITGRGIFNGAELGASKNQIVSALDASGNRSIGSIAGATNSSFPLGPIPSGGRAQGDMVAFTDSTGRSVRIDPLTGRISEQFGEDGKLISQTALSLSEMQRVKKALGDKRYMTGVEIAIACAIASAAVAKSRNSKLENDTQGEAIEPTESEADAAAQGLKLLLEDVKWNDNSTSSNSSVLAKANVFKRQTYVIAHNDSLVEIAEQLYHDADVAWLIADINIGRISEHLEDGKRIIELRSRQEIELPHPSEVQDFILAKAKDAKAENMVTIVAVTEIDRELLDSFLSTVVGGEKTEILGRPSEVKSPQIGNEEADFEPDFRPLMHLIDYGINWGKSLMPTMTAIMTKGLNLKTYISRIDMIPARPMVATLEPEPQR